MTVPPAPRLRRLWLWPVLAAASCQPLPHPFAYDKPPAALLAVRDTAGVAIAPIVGAPLPIARKLADAVAKAFLKHDIPASDRTTSRDSFQLYGRVIASPPVAGQTTVVAGWSLYDAKGKLVGERRAQIVAAAGDWQSGLSGPVAQLAALSADQVAPLLVGNMPTAVPVATDTPRLRVAVGKIVGAPGDGVSALQTAAAAVLQHAGVAVVTDGKADLSVGAEVAVSPAAAGRQHVRIVWHVRRADGIEIGTVAQENDVPAGQLDGAWGDTAYNVAIAAEGGLMQLIARGAPSPESDTAAAVGGR